MASAKERGRTKRQRAPPLRERYGRGGRRPGAGRKRKPGRGRVPHRRRPSVTPREPVHVTWRFAAGVPSLRAERCRGIVRQALLEARDGDRFRVVEWVVLPSHLHLVVECASAAELARGVRSLATKLLRRLRAAVGLSGPLVAERYHAHVLRTLQEALNAVRYVRDNWRRHLVDHADAIARIAPGCGPTPPPRGWVDPLSSAAPTWAAAARSWLLRTARQRLAG